MDKYLFFIVCILCGNLHITVIALFTFSSLVRFLQVIIHNFTLQKNALSIHSKNPRESAAGQFVEARRSSWPSAATVGRPPLRIQVPETDTIELF